MESYKTLKVEVTGEGIMKITLHQPEIKNAFSSQMVSFFSFLLFFPPSSPCPLS